MEGEEGEGRGRLTRGRLGECWMVGLRDWEGMREGRGRVGRD